MALMQRTTTNTAGRVLLLLLMILRHHRVHSTVVHGARRNVSSPCSVGSSRSERVSTVVVVVTVQRVAELSVDRDKLRGRRWHHRMLLLLRLLIIVSKHRRRGRLIAVRIRIVAVVVVVVVGGHEKRCRRIHFCK